MKTIGGILAGNEQTVLELIRRLFAMGFDTKDIASALGISEASVWNIVGRHPRRAAP